VTAKRRLGGKPVHADGEFKDLAPALPPPMPECSPVRAFGGYQKRASAGQPRQYAFAAACGCGKACALHGHGHAWALPGSPPDDRKFWGALGCPCWAF